MKSVPLGPVFQIKSSIINHKNGLLTTLVLPPAFLLLVFVVGWLSLFHFLACLLFYFHHKQKSVHTVLIIAIHRIAEENA